MRLIEFTRDAAAAKRAASELGDDEIIAIHDTVNGEQFTVAGWSRYVPAYDEDKLDRYIYVSTKLFGECTSSW